MYVLKEQEIYQKLNIVEREYNFYKGYCWIPYSSLHKVKECLGRVGIENKQIIKGEIKEITVENKYLKRPPTLFKLNYITR